MKFSQYLCDFFIHFFFQLKKKQKQENTFCSNEEQKYGRQSIAKSLSESKQNRALGKSTNALANELQNRGAPNNAPDTRGIQLYTCTVHVRIRRGCAMLLLYNAKQRAQKSTHERKRTSHMCAAFVLFFVHRQVLCTPTKRSTARCVEVQRSMLELAQINRVRASEIANAQRGKVL